MKKTLTVNGMTIQGVMAPTGEKLVTIQFEQEGGGNHVAYISASDAESFKLGAKYEMTITPVVANA